ncbi:telomeric repeat binding factor a isoform X2 [Lampris incognitus]|uniref:telomeric repeat binding factor a isoform X2 n=1 Tax=Lampris incognitus TaxID=2546036 RepID=UPI0024B494CD|nr:telomeric repeat binding factor a isoform X2 [Lampris incognitus]
MSTESIVNRWLVDYYAFLAIESFKDNRYSDFCTIRDVLRDVVSRPLESSPVITTKLRVLQFLSRINDGDKIHSTFDKNMITPLESAMLVLVNMAKECKIPQQDLENIHTSIKEMLVIICIKTMEFEKAKEMLNKHFPKGMVGKKAIFMGLINQKRKTHEVLEQVTFQKFKKEMVQFCESLLPPSFPFLHKAAKQLFDQRFSNQGDDTEELQTDEQHKPAQSPDGFTETVQFGPCSSTSEHTVIQRKRLEAAYAALAGDSCQPTLVQILEEVEREELNKTSKVKGNLPPHPSASSLYGTDMEPNLDIHFPRDSGSPVESCRTDQEISELRTMRRYTVAQLVVEPDSLESSHCSTAFQEQETRIRPEQLLALNSEENLLSPVKANENRKSISKYHRQASKAPNNDPTVIQRKRLEAAYAALAGDSWQPTFVQLLEEVEREELNKSSKVKGNLPPHPSASPLYGTDMEPNLDIHFQRDLGSPVESCRTDQDISELRGMRQYTVAQLVVEPDILESSHCSTASQEQETRIGPEQLLAPNSEENLLSPVKAKENTKPTRKYHRQASKAPNNTSTELTQSTEKDVDNPVSSDGLHRTSLRKLCKRQGSDPLRKNSTESKPLSDNSDEDLLSSLDISTAPVWKRHKRQASSSLGKNPRGSDDMFQIDSSSDSSTNHSPHPVHQKSSTSSGSQKIALWKQLFNNAKETNDTWSDEDSLFNGTTKGSDNGSSSSSLKHRRRVWTDEESKMLKDAVARCGEGNWSKIQLRFPFKGRTNVNLKDRWRTMKNLNMV